MSVSCECCVLSCRGLCDGPIAHPEESYQLWCVIVCVLETSSVRWPWLALGCCARNNNSNGNVKYIVLDTTDIQGVYFWIAFCTDFSMIY